MRFANRVHETRAAHGQLNGKSQKLGEFVLGSTHMLEGLTCFVPIGDIMSGAMLDVLAGPGSGTPLTNPWTCVNVVVTLGLVPFAIVHSMSGLVRWTPPCRGL